MKITYNTVWENCVRNVISHPGKYFLPESLSDLVSIVQEAEQKDLQVRAVGSGHSYSEVAKINGYLVDLVRLNRPLDDFRRALLAGQSDTLVELQAGMTIRDMNRYLDSKGLSVVNMGGVDVQKVAGAVSTATHGSGLSLPSFPGMVRSFVLVSGGGKAFRIEPKDKPLSDPIRFAQENPGIELIQDDDIFYSSLVSFGCMGLIYSLVFEMRKQYFLAELRFLEKWETVKSWIRSGEIFTQDYTSRIKTKSREKLSSYWTTGLNDNRSLMVRMNPYKVEGSNDHTCMIIVHREIKSLPPRSMGEVTRNPGISILSTLAGDIVTGVGRFLFNNRPHGTPKSIEASLKQEVDNIYVANAHESLFLGLVNIKEHGFTTEFAFNQNDPSNYIDAVDSLVSILAQKAKDLKVYQTGQIGFRWVQKSKAYLAPEFKQDVCYLDVSCLEGTFGSIEILGEVQEHMLSKKGWPHWGKLNNCLVRQTHLIDGKFPKLPVWKDTAIYLDPKGTFKNKFSNDLGLR